MLYTSTASSGVMTFGSACRWGGNAAKQDRDSHTGGSHQQATIKAGGVVGEKAYHRRVMDRLTTVLADVTHPLSLPEFDSRRIDRSGRQFRGA